MFSKTQDKRVLRTLMATTALGGVMATYALPAAAADDCGAPTAGVVTCTVAGGPYADISYSGVASGLRVNAETGVTADSLRVDGSGTLTVRAANGSRFAASGPDARGIEVLGQGVVDVIADDAEASGDRAIAINARGAGDVAVFVNDIIASGYQAHGVYANSDTGSASVAVGSVKAIGGTLGAGITASAHTDVVVQFGVVEVAGDERYGVDAFSDQGDVYVGKRRDLGNDAGDITASGREAAGLIATANLGNVEIEVRDVTLTGGTGAYAIDLDAHKDVSATFRDLSVTGFDSIGLSARSYSGSVDLTGGAITTDGNNGYGLFINSDNLTGSVDSVRTSGDDATGLNYAQSLGAGVVDFAVGSIETLGEGANAVELNGSEGDYTFKVGSIATAGREAKGILLNSGAADYVLEAGTITTSGDQSNGVLTQDLAASLKLKADAITTAGFNAHAIDIRASDIELDLGALTTSGRAAGGIVVTADTVGLGQTAIRGSVESITTTGLGSHGAVVATTGRLDLTFGAIHTGGLEAKGITAYADGGGVLKATSIVTEGDYAIGANLVSFLGGFDARFGSIETRGEESNGVYLESLGDSLVWANSIKTSGLNAAGVVLTGESGDYVLKVGSIATSGDESEGVVLGAIEGARFNVELGEVTTTGEMSTAVTTDFGGLSGRSESLMLKANSLSTTGESSSGLYLYGSDLNVEVGKITTTGDYASGGFMSVNGAAIDTVAIKASFGQIDTSGDESDGMRLQTIGRFDVTLGSVHTRGEESVGFGAYSAGGGLLKANSILTEGDYAMGAQLESQLGGFDATFGNIETRGVEAYGVHLQSSDDSAIGLGAVRTSGARANGVYAAVLGNLTLGADDVRTTGSGAVGIEVAATGDIALALGSIETTGAEADAVLAHADGAVRLAGSRRLTSASGAAANLTGASIEVNLASTSFVEGSAAGLRLDAAAASTVTNAGSISSANGYAIDAVAGKVTLNNAGLVSGRVRFAGADDLVNNLGRFTASGTSDFGVGADVFNNSGTLDLAIGTTPRSATFGNLERLNNTGMISLANGVAGDVFTVSGVIDGQGANTIALDLDLRGATPAADRIVGGGFAGLSHILLSVQGDNRLGDTGVVLAQSGMGQTGAEIDVEVAGGGFIDYYLALSGNDYRLQAELALSAFEPTKIASGAQHQWTSGADVVSARFEHMRDEGVREGRGLQVWSQVFGGSNDVEAQRTFEIEDETIDADLTHEVKSRGVQAGVDRTVSIARGSLAFGALASTGTTELRFQNGDRTRYVGQGVGAYGHWTDGPLSVGVLVKLDRFDLDYDWAEAGMRTSADGSTIGVRLDAAWRVDLGDTWFVESQGSVSWSDTSLDSIASDTGGIDFGQTRSLVGKIGMRAGGKLALANGLSLRPYAGLHALNEFEGDNISILHLGSDSIEIRDEAQGVGGRATLGAGLGGATGLGGYVQAEQDFGDVEGFTARIGLRYAW